jgi:hypothetical protein
MESRGANKADRCGTRIPCAIPITLKTLNSTPLSEECLIVLVNPQGCAARLRRAVDVGTTVQLEGLPSKTSAIARVVNCISLGQYERSWLLGFALDEPGNVWGVKSPPSDWVR